MIESLTGQDIIVTTERASFAGTLKGIAQGWMTLSYDPDTWSGPRVEGPRSTILIPFGKIESVVRVEPDRPNNPKPMIAALKKAMKV